MRIETKKIRSRLIIAQAFAAGSCLEITQTTRRKSKPNMLEATCPKETNAAKMIKQIRLINGCTIYQ